MLKTSDQIKEMPLSEAPSLDLDLQIFNGKVSSNIYDKLDDFVIWHC